MLPVSYHPATQVACHPLVRPPSSHATLPLNVLDGRTNPNHQVTQPVVFKSSSAPAFRHPLSFHSQVTKPPSLEMPAMECSDRVLDSLGDGPPGARHEKGFRRRLNRFSGTFDTNRGAQSSHIPGIIKMIHRGIGEWNVLRIRF